MAANAAIVSSNGDYADPFAGEKPLYTVTKDNVSQYKNVLTPGQVAMFGRFPDYRMPVYPTHRTANLPKTDQDEAKANLGKVELADGGYGLKNYSFGVPFAEPTEPLE
ncbi:outer membrane lipoprotein-sorting protein, partial [Bacillus sp. AFS076308]